MTLLLKSSETLLSRAAQVASSTQRVVTRPGLAGRVRSFQSRKSALDARGSSKRRGRALMATTVLAASATADSAFDFTVSDIDGKKVDLSKYKGKVVLVVNVASQCGFTPQYKELGELYTKYSKQGFVILGFPCNQFGGQEPADNSRIKQFALDRGAKFPMMGKVNVNGSDAEPFYKFLKSKQSGLLVSDIKWNFTKFLVNKNGEVVKRYGSATTPLSIEKDIQSLL